MTPRRGCDVCLQQSSDVPAGRYPDDGMTNNLMNGKGGRYLSPKQLGKVHRAFATKSIGLASSGFSITPKNITTDQTWDFPLQLYRPLVIKAGATLTLQCTLQMPPKGDITIEPGGKLIVDGGLITRSNLNAGESWRGIKIKKSHKHRHALIFKEWWGIGVCQIGDQKKRLPTGSLFFLMLYAGLLL
ncbi:MAG: hypothetical protein U5L96_11690 [Owenweeksia sp.]|nr:hypothetical protein [Owenweeksia sp.]